MKTWEELTGKPLITININIKCEKRAYETYAEAQTMVNKANHWHSRYSNSNKKTAKPKPKTVYKCEYCNKYHLSGKIKPKI